MDGHPAAAREVLWVDVRGVGVFGFGHSTYSIIFVIVNNDRAVALSIDILNECF
jgi:hypothetical protein